jgi:hypothetical protein
MIGNPTNFVHTGTLMILINFPIRSSIVVNYFLGHIGSNDAELSSQHLNIIQSQMQSKGGYDLNSLRMQVRKITKILWLATQLINVSLNSHFSQLRISFTASMLIKSAAAAVQST